MLYPSSPSVHYSSYCGNVACGDKGMLDLELHTVRQEGAKSVWLEGQTLHSSPGLPTVEHLH